MVDPAAKLGSPVKMTQALQNSSPLGMDRSPALISKIDQPVVVRRPENRTTPILAASPHSGRIYPPELLQQTATPLSALRRSEDAYVDLLIDSAPDNGITTITAPFPRVFVDPNRSTQEFDPLLFEDYQPSTVSSTLHVEAGLGVIPRISADGHPLYADRLPLSEGRQRLADYYRPYHGAIDVEMKAARDVFGLAILLDVHSMPSIAATGVDVVLGDRHGTSCHPRIVETLESLFLAEGLRVQRNRPYAGGFITTSYGRPSAKRHAIQIELNRALYLDEVQVTRSDTFEQTRALLGRVLDQMGKTRWTF